MNSPRFTPEFKEEAVRQIVEHGYSVAEVSERLGAKRFSRAASPTRKTKKVLSDPTYRQTKKRQNRRSVSAVIERFPAIIWPIL